jgi:DNA-binding XRE family transcriptional regulator
MKYDLLHIQGKPYVLVPLHDYRALTSVPSDEGTLPPEILDTLAAGQETPVRILRKFRGLTQAELADKAGLSRPYLTEIESGKKNGSVRAMKAIAQALDVSVNQIAG